MMARERGFTLLEMMVVVLLFTLVTGAVFSLLNTAQQRYRTESQVLDSFQSAREVMDQMTREVHSAGYPSPRLFPQFNADPATSTNVATNFPTNSNGPCPLGVIPYPIGATCQQGVNGCQPGVSCFFPLYPDNFTLAIEEDLDPENNNGVEWVIYTLRDANGNFPGLPPNVLWRRVMTKVAGAGAGNLDGEGWNLMNFSGLIGNVALAGFAPVVYNVMNDPRSNNQPVGAGCNDYTPTPPTPPRFAFCEDEKLFSFDFDTVPTGSLPTAQKIRTLYINLIVRSQDRDPKTNLYRIVTLRASANRYN